jgi:hypothetical protein
MKILKRITRSQQIGIHRLAVFVGSKSDPLQGLAGIIHICQDASYAKGSEPLASYFFTCAKRICDIYDEWIKSDPDYWKPKATTSVAKTAADKKVSEMAEKKPQP